MRQQVKSDLTQQAILNESFRLFYENGFKTTSVDKIMRSLQLTKGAFYHHFKNKSELGIAVINSHVQKRVEVGMIEPLSQEGDALEIIRNVFTNRIVNFPMYDKMHGCPMNNLINEIGDYETVYQLALKSIIDRWRGELCQKIEKGKTEKSINANVSSEATATYLISAFEGIRGIRKLYNDDQVLDQFIKGINSYIDQLKA